MDERAPAGLREGVRSEIRASLIRDAELRGHRTARMLAVSGLVGVVGAFGVTLLLSGHPYGHHPTWHVLVFSVVWAGLLVVMVALALLGVRTPALPLARSASVALLGLGIAGLCGALCPNQHFLVWWADTSIGGWAASIGGAGLAAFCFGALTSFAVGAPAALLALRNLRQRPIRPLLPSAMLLLLLAPGIVLQSIGTEPLVLPSWLIGGAGGGYLGVWGGIGARRWALR